MSEAFKCLVLGCENASDQGTMVGPLCAPCDHMLRTGQPNAGNDFVSATVRENISLRASLVSIQRTAKHAIKTI